uniref:Uncharacterized protein n=1 Tax=Peromyscus maniculatus bairdii TaxID=230844 RepID=A0A8C9CT14_PERMB
MTQWLRSLPALPEDLPLNHDGGDTNDRDIINALCFSQNCCRLCAATGPSVKIWDLEGEITVDELKQDITGTGNKVEWPQCTASADGQTLFAGYTGNLVQVRQVTTDPH